MTRTISGLIFAVLVCAAPLASAQGGARELFESGHAAYRVGDYEKALELWKNAYELDPRPHLQFNIGQAYERLGELEEAIAATERYLEETSPSDPNRGDAVGRIAKLRERLERTSILVRTDVEGAIIEIDGEERARTPRLDPIRVAPGRHTVVVRHADHPAHRASVRVVAGEVFDLEAPLASAPEVASSEAEAGERNASVPGIILAGAGGALALTGVGLGAAAIRGAKDAPGSTGSDADRARGLSTGADVLLFTGLAAAAGGVIWAVLANRNARPADDEGVSFRVVPAAGRSTLGISLTGDF